MYLVFMIFIGLLVSPIDEHLFESSGVAAFPFVIARQTAGIKGQLNFFNVVIMIGVADITAESLYITSRMLRAMSYQRLIPAWVAGVNSKGHPRAFLAIT